MNKPSVIVEGLSKKFGLSLKSALKYGMADSFRRLTGRGKNENLRPGEFWALKDVNFSLNPGDALGIMGVNGSGKTTLLRILNGSYTPDEGRAMLRGRVGALIAAGAGFSPMLTGRENVFISGTLLGMHPSEIRRKFDEIVAFADLGEFIDMPIRNYSSGMSVRLGFAVAVLGSPEILLVDEVLAVGDIAFQKKCFERIYALKNEGTTILLVSHAPGAIWAICNKGLILHHGLTQGVIPVEEACRRYDDLNAVTRSQSLQKLGPQQEISSEYNNERCGSGDVFISNIKILHGLTEEPLETLVYGEPFIIELDINTKEVIEDGIIRCSIDSELYRAVSIVDSYESVQQTFTIQEGESIARFLIENPKLRPGAYSFTCSVLKRAAAVHLYLEFNMHPISVIHNKDMFLYADFRSYMHIDSVFYMQKKELHGIDNYFSIMKMSQDAYCFKQNIKQVSIEFSSDCNRRCQYCPQSIVPREARFIKEELLLKIILQLKSIHYKYDICLNIYNEPMIHFDVLIRVMQIISEHLPEARITFSTNGDYLTVEKLQILKNNGLRSLTISAHQNQTEWDKQKGIVDIQRICAKIEVPSSDVSVYDSDVHKRIQYDTLEILMFSRDFCKTGVTRAGSTSAYVHTPENFQRNAVCHRPRNDFSISYDGSVYPCCQFYHDIADNLRFLAGNVEQDSMFTIYNSNIFTMFRKIAEFKAPDIEPCISCKEPT